MVQLLLQVVWFAYDPPTTFPQLPVLELQLYLASQVELFAPGFMQVLLLLQPPFPSHSSTSQLLLQVVWLEEDPPATTEQLPVLELQLYLASQVELFAPGFMQV